MPIAYPPASPTISGDYLTISRFLNNPPLVLRALRDIGDQMFISDKILTSNITTESGSVIYEQNETIFADRAPQPVAPLSEYPMTSVSTGPALTANTVKWGNDTELSDEAISRQKYPVVARGFRKLMNSHIQQIDSVALSAVNSAVTQNTAAIAAWSATDGSARILRDLMRAQAKIVDLKQGYMPNVVLLSMDTFANVVSDDKLAAALPREYPGVATMPVGQGLDSTFMRRIGGFTFITSPNLPYTNTATLLDSNVFGSFVDEYLQGEGYVSDGVDNLQVLTERKTGVDGWRIRARRTVVPIVQEPAAAWKITGVDS